MPYNKQHVSVFEGVALTPESDTIKDGQGSDILNLRMDKLGYLVNREGVRAFEFTHVSAPELPDIQKISGTTAIGEFILSSPVTDKVDFDPRADNVIASVVNASHSYPLSQYDSFMVYGLRCTLGDAPSQGHLVYVLVPNSEVPDNITAIPIDNDKRNLPMDGGDCVYFLRPQRPGESVNSRSNPLPMLVAPARRLSHGNWVNPSTGKVDDENWIEHYGRMEQFMGSLVIADRVNGDMIIHDAWDEAEPGETKKHILRVEQNVKAFFDVDIVKVDFRLGTGEENGDGVENGMALYKFYLQKKQAVHTHDNYTKGKYSEKVGENVASVNIYSAGFGHSSTVHWDFLVNEFREAMLNGINLSALTDDGRYQGGLSKFLYKDTISQKYTFSDYTQPTEFLSILDKVTFHDPDTQRIYDEKGKPINNDAADVFIWNDLKLKYYPCSSIEQESIFLRGKDREFSKKVSITPKIVKLKTQADVEQEIPLGVYAYRFVIGFGNGSYSIPSAPLLAPDKLWSALKDSAAFARNTRFVNNERYDGCDRHTSFIGLHTTTGATGIVEPFFPLTTTDGTTLSNYGELLKKVKAAIYESDHIFGSLANVDDFSTLASVYHHATKMELNGTAMSSYYFEAHQRDVILQHRTQHRIMVPLVPEEANPLSYNSVFTKTSGSSYGGRYRVAYQDWLLRYQNTAHELVFGGAGTTFCKWINTQADSSTFDIDVIRYENEFLYYNMVCHDDEGNNGTITHPEYRFPTLLRYVNDESNRLSYFKSDANVEATSRLVASGIAEFLLTDYTSWLTARAQRWGGPEYNNDPNPNDTDHLEYNKVRTVHNYKCYTDDGIMVIPDIGFKDGSGKEFGKCKTTYDTINDMAGWTSDNSEIFNFLIQTSGTKTDQPWVRDNTVDPDNPYRWFRLSNCRICFHLPGERLLAPEQLTAYFPSSLLFNSPRVGLKIAKEDIPVRAKELLIFRTLASHDNDWQPTKFGLVDTLKFDRETDGSAKDFYYFDEKKDTELDFASSPDEYDGIVEPLKSAFVKQLKERVWMANFIETYQAYPPRGYIENEGTVQPADLKPNSSYTNARIGSWREILVDDLPGYADQGFNDTLVGQYVQYFIIFKTIDGSYSKPKYLLNDIGAPALIDFTSAAPKLAAVALMLNGYPYKGSIESCEVYRRKFTMSGPVMSDSKFYRIGEIKPEDEGVFVDLGIENSSVVWGQYDSSSDLLAVSDPIVEEKKSKLAWCETDQPSWIKYTSRMGFRDGDGDQITGLEVIYSELIVFKERSIHRVTLKNDSNEIGRIEEVANNYGCIAPNTLISYDNTVYFLSWLGLMRYDNNKVVKVDGAFGHELDMRLREEYMGIRNPAIRDASVAINPAFHELYLNIPAYAGAAGYDYRQEGLKGCVYVINLDTSLVTKFQYETGDYQIFVPGEDEDTTQGTYPRSMGKLYKHNSRGQLWSGEILPKVPGLRTFIQLESPTGRHYDMFQPGIKSDGTPETVESIATEDVHSWWKSKSWSFDDKTMMKRVRNVISYFSKGTNIKVGVEFNNSEYQSSAYHESQFGVTGELTKLMPRRDAGYDRGERFNIHLASQGETEIQNMSFYWRPVNTWAR